MNGLWVRTSDADRQFCGRAYFRDTGWTDRLCVPNSYDIHFGRLDGTSSPLLAFEMDFNRNHCAQVHDVTGWQPSACGRNVLVGSTDASRPLTAVRMAY
jgi:hypothetical protein